jgi:hypothetical protein
MRFALVFVCLTAASTVAAGEPARRPNLLLRYADDRSSRTVGGHPEARPGVTTPHLDALARSGVRSLGARCTPSHASIPTGLQPHAIRSMTTCGTWPTKPSHARRPGLLREALAVELRRPGAPTAATGASGVVTQEKTP